MEFGTLFKFTSFEIMFCAVSYHNVTLMKDWMGFETGTEIYRVDVCMEKGLVDFIDSNESVIMSGKFA